MFRRTVGAEIRRGLILEGVRPLLARTPETLVNLECVVSEEGESHPGKARSLQRATRRGPCPHRGRHQHGQSGQQSRQRFWNDRASGFDQPIKSGQHFPIGAGETAATAYLPYFSQRTGIKGAPSSRSMIRTSARQIATARDIERVTTALAKARSEASFVFVFVALGDENTERNGTAVSGLRLIDHGADAVAGSHPHCVQPADSYHGRPIIYSLGNLVFDGAPTLPGWNRGQFLEFNLAAGRPTLRLVPVQLDVRGFPSLTATNENQEREKSFATAGAAFSRNRVQGASKNR